MAGSLRSLKLKGKIQIGGAEIEVWSDIDSLRKQLKRFSTGGITRAQFRALNRAANKAKTLTGRLLSKDYNIKVGDIKPFLKLSPRATAKNTTVAIRARSSQLSIFKFAKGVKRQTARGVRFNSGGGSRVHPHTFFARMDSGHSGIFVRETKTRFRRDFNVSPSTGRTYQTHLGIRELLYPSVAHMITNPVRANKIFELFVNDYPRQLHSQLDFELKKSKGLV